MPAFCKLSAVSCRNSVGSILEEAIVYAKKRVPVLGMENLLLFAENGRKPIGKSTMCAENSAVCGLYKSPGCNERLCSARYGYSQELTGVRNRCS